MSTACGSSMNVVRCWWAIFDRLDALLVPCVLGEAPKGLDSTGDASMQAIWTALHTPSMTLPTHRGPGNLPVGIQLVGQRYESIV